MNRNDIIEYLQQEGCVVVRNDRRGYTVIRNVVSGKMSGVPKEENQYPATVCRICKTLGIETPDEAKLAQDIIDTAHKRHGLEDN